MSVTPISLYLQLEEGANADMEVVGKAAIAFSQAVKEAVFIYDPSRQVRIELVSGEEGSLDLRTIIRDLKEKKVGDKSLGALAFAVALGFANTNWQYIYGKLMDHQLGIDEQTATLATADREKLLEDVAKVVGSSSVDSRICSVYRELQKDTAVSGVGVTIEAGKKPDIIVPRSEFKQRIEGPPEDLITRKREHPEDERVLLLSPYLKPDDHKWRFCGRYGNFSASIKDSIFLEQVISGRIVIPMIGGVELDVLLNISEEWKDGVWMVTERTVLEVRGIHKPPEQGRLDLPPPDPANRQGKARGSKK